MFGFGSLSHLLIVLVLALVLIGPKQLPEVAKAIAKLLVELRRASNMLSDEFRHSMGEEEFRRTIQPPPPQQTPYSQNPQQASSGNPKAEIVSGATPNAEEKKS